MREETCSVCGAVGPVTEFDGHRLCGACLARETVVCSHCGTRLWAEDNAGTLSLPLCADCYEESYTTCCECGRIISVYDACCLDDDGEEPCCPQCFSRRSKAIIHDYYYKPAPIFYGEGPRYFGVELEIDQGGERPDYAERLLAIANRDAERLYIKHDGSISDGFEAVTHPISLEYHLHTMPWAELLEEAARLGYRSHQTNTCGLHIHVSRKAFGETQAEQDAAIGRVLFFIEKNWSELLRFSRRTPQQLERWAARYGYRDQPKELLEHAKYSCPGRYVCLNLENADTIEFRIFRGTLNLNTVKATLQLTDRICTAAICLTDEEMRDLSWSGFVSAVTEPELIRYLKERRLYVNDPVCGEVEL